MRIAALILAVALAACATPGQVVVGTPAIVVTEKALTLAHKFYDATGETLITLAQTGVIKGQAAATARCWYARAGNALDAADAADAVVNASVDEILADIVKMQDALVQASVVGVPAGCQ